MTNEIVVLPKQEIIELIASGKSEFQISKELNIPMLSIVEALVKDKDFADRLSKARQVRSEKWVNGVIQLIQSESGIPIIHDKDDVPGVKLAIDTFKWLAKVDNPNKYGDKVDINVESNNIYEIRGLSVTEALDIIRNDPFAPKTVEAEYVVQQRLEGDSDDEDML